MTSLRRKWGTLPSDREPMSKHVHTTSRTERIQGAIPTFARWALIAGLTCAFALGAFREWRTARLAAPFVRDLPTDYRLASARIIVNRVARHFRSGDRGQVPFSFPLRVAADAITDGHSCGDAALAVAAILHTRHWPITILQVNVTEAGASHVMVELYDEQRHVDVLADPLTGRMFETPAAPHHPLSIDEIRAPGVPQAWLPAEYHPSGAWSLFARNRRTNWERFGAIAGVLESVLGRAALERICVRALFVEPGRLIALSAVALLALFSISRLRRRERNPVASKQEYLMATVDVPEPR